ncbi:hypothetical protein CCO04_26780 [Pimelobacter sp. 30-1]|nr:hypothetical protein [Pimelobacter sp. 30-1]
MLAVGVAIGVMLTRPAPKAPAPSGGANALGTLIHDEAHRAEADFSELRRHGQAVLTIAGVLVAALSTLFGFAASKDDVVSMPRTAVALITISLVFFVMAGVFVLLMFLPARIKWPDARGLKNLVTASWDSPGWDKSVADVTTDYLVSLRKANSAQHKKLSAAVGLEVAGIFLSAAAAVALIAPTYAGR